MAKIISVYNEWNFNDEHFVVVEYNSGTTKRYQIRQYSDKLPETVKTWLRHNSPRVLEDIEAEINPLGMSACLQSIRFDVEVLNLNPFEKLKEFKERAKTDVFFNKTMIEATERYIEENGLTEEEEKKEMTNEERAEAKTRIRVFKEDVISAYENTETPKECVAWLADQIGHEEAKKAVATVVNMVSLSDGRIYDGVREWSQSVDGAFDNATCRELGFYGVDSWIHSAHVNQIGEAMKNYEPPTEPEEEPEEVEHTTITTEHPTLGEVLGRFNENMVVRVYCDGDLVATYDGRNSIPEALNGCGVVMYEETNSFGANVYLEEGSVEDVTDTMKELKECSDYAEYICDYQGSKYWCDAVSEIADGNTAIYCYDVYEYISNHVEEVEEAISEHGWKGVGETLSGAGQRAQYLEISNELYDNWFSVAKLYALGYYRDEHGDAITKEIRERIEEEIENHGSPDRLWDLESIVDQTVEVMARG